MKACAFSLAFLFITAAVITADARTWTDSQGRQIQAKFVRVDGPNVVLLQGNKTVRAPFTLFSEEDQEYVREQLKREGKEHLLPKARSSAKPGLPPALRPVETPADPGSPKAEETKKPQQEPPRTWTDAQGKQFVAAFAGMEGSEVTLVEDGRNRTVSLSNLSPEDRKYVAEKMRDRVLGQLMPGGPPAIGPGGISPPALPPSPPPGIGNTAEEMRRRHTERMKEHEERMRQLREKSMAGGPPVGPSGPSGPSYQPPPGPSIPRPSVPTFPTPSMPTHQPSPGPSYQPPPAPSFPSPTVSPSLPPSGPSGPQFEYEYICTNCKKSLPASVKAGDHCPHCKAYLSYEEGPGGQRKYAPGAGLAGGIAVGVIAVLALLFKVLRS